MSKRTPKPAGKKRSAKPRAAKRPQTAPGATPAIEPPVGSSAAAASPGAANAVGGDPVAAILQPAFGNPLTGQAGFLDNLGKPADACSHEFTHRQVDPDDPAGGESIEVCDVCGLSRKHFPTEVSEWVGDEPLPGLADGERPPRLPLVAGVSADGKIEGVDVVIPATIVQLTPPAAVREVDPADGFKRFERVEPDVPVERRPWACPNCGCPAYFKLQKLDTTDSAGTTNNGTEYIRVERELVRCKRCEHQATLMIFVPPPPGSEPPPPAPRSALARSTPENSQTTALLERIDQLEARVNDVLAANDQLRKDNADMAAKLFSKSPASAFA